jgi:hypothetical protein
VREEEGAMGGSLGSGGSEGEATWARDRTRDNRQGDEDDTDKRVPLVGARKKKGERECVRVGCLCWAGRAGPIGLLLFF